MPAEEITRTLSLLFAPGQIVEVRAITEEGMASGYFDDPGALTAAVAPLDVTGTAGVYVTLNEVNPALLSRRANRIKMRLSKKDATTADTDIVRRRWFPVDIDPVRPSGVSSTDEEHQATLVRAAEVAAYLGRERGWPAPIMADSGNGAHLLYRIDMPNDEACRDLVKRCLEVLDVLFSNRASTIDTANFNAARIWKLYGTVSRKGDHTADRPHRRASLIDAPDEPGTVTRDMLRELAGLLPVQPPPPENGQRAGGGRPAIDLRTWLCDHGIAVADEKPYQGGTLFVLEECPFSGAHRDGAFAIQFGSGAVYAGCHHASCGGGSQRWKELRERYEKRGGGRDRARPPARAERRPVPPGSSGGPAMPPDTDTIPGRDDALTVLQHGDPVRAMLRAFALDHVGDEVVAECLVMSLASRSVENTNGLHVSVTGESGKGKSHAFSTLLRQVPARFRLEGAMSNKALFYLEDLQPGSVIVLDDRALSDDLAEILKGVTTSFRSPFVYRTVSRDRRAQVCTIPERCVWWVAKVEGAGDDQVFNRMLTCWIDDTEEQDTRVLARVLARAQGVPENPDEERPEVMVCRAMWELIGRQRFHVVIPFAPRIRFQAAANRRNPEMLLDLVKANTVLRFMQRERTRAGSLACLVATREDFFEATRLYGLLNGTSGGQQTKLTKRESELLEVIRGRDWAEFTIPMLQRETRLSNASLHRIIHGYASRGAMYSGLLEKCPAIAYTDRTVVTSEATGGLSMRRRTNAYTFDHEIFRSWSSGGSVWIDDNDDRENPSALQQSFSSPTEGAEGHGVDGECLDQDNNNKNSVWKNKYPVSFSTTAHTEHPPGEGACAPAPVCDPKSAEGHDRTSPLSPPIPDASPDCAGTTPRKSLQQAGPFRGTDNQGRIDARDYKPLDFPERSPCHLCGAPVSHYVEKLTKERKARPKDQQAARRICRACFGSAKERAQQNAVILPGTFDLSRMEPVRSAIGRCTVCDLDPAAYIDRSTDTRLCEVCYQRAARAAGSGEVAG